MKLTKIFPIIALLTIAFMAGCKKDDVVSPVPTVTSINPTSEATSIAINSKISASFSAEMDPATITAANFTLQQGSETVLGTLEYSGTTAIFTPTANLKINSFYTATISAEVKDISGNSIGVDYVWNFTTAAFLDITLPTVTLTNPINGAISVDPSKAIELTFSEAMDPSTINNSTFTLKQGTSVVSGLVTYSGTVATFTPTNLLDALKTYIATITIGAKDLAGNALAANSELSFTTVGSASNLAVVDLGTAGNYVILAETAINNSSTSAITGNLGLSPAATSYITGLSLTNLTGYATSAQVTGQIFAADMADPTPINLTTAVGSMVTAYNDAAGRPSPDFSELGTGNIGGKTLIPGLYKWTNSVTLPSDVTISGGANDVWIFQISGDLIMSSAVNITLIGGAQAKNIFWQVAGQATIGTTSHFEGVILSKTAVTFQTGASINGRVLAQTAVILDNNAVVMP